MIENIEDEVIGWSLSDDDKFCLNEIIDATKRLGRMARSGSCLAGIGEIWDMLENILDSEGNYESEISVSLSVEFSVGDANFNEGQIACMEVYQDIIELSIINRNYNSEVGSDRETHVAAVLTQEGSFNRRAVSNWLKELEFIKGNENSMLRAERNHI